MSRNNDGFICMDLRFVAGPPGCPEGSRRTSSGRWSWCVLPRQRCTFHYRSVVQTWEYMISLFLVIHSPACFDSTSTTCSKSLVQTVRNFQKGFTEWDYIFWITLSKINVKLSDWILSEYQWVVDYNQPPATATDKTVLCPLKTI